MTFVSWFIWKLGLPLVSKVLLHVGIALHMVSCRDLYIV
jgi:hypothetical protein